MKGKNVAVFLGDGIADLSNGDRIVDALIALERRPGNAGSKIHVIASECNQMGAYDMGVMPDEGLDLSGMIEAAEKGRLKVMYILGENPFSRLPDKDKVRRALEKLDLLVVQDIFPSETADLADVVLPGAAFFEKSGSFTNMEGRIQRFEATARPAGEARPDWEILGLLAEELGARKNKKNES